ncbi:MAG: hypothetical protein IKF64_00370 [Eubacterium sp.]|nr:hypothetical protein [Eubacterium sp.]
MSVLVLGILYIVTILLAIAFRVCFAFSINYDSRARNIRATTAFTVLTVFFPIITGIVYACMRHDAQQNTKFCASCNTLVDGAIKMCPECKGMVFKRAPHPETVKFVKRSVSLFVAAVIIFFCGLGVSAAETVIAVKLGADAIRSYDKGGFDKWAGYFIDEFASSADKEKSADAENQDGEEAETSEQSEEDTTADIDSIIGNLTYYDRDGKAYKNAVDVPYYSKDGKIFYYVKEPDLTQYFIEEGSKTKLDIKRCFVDKDGYFIFDEKGEITLNDDIVTASDKDGNTYIPASLAIWNEKGELITMF